MSNSKKSTSKLLNQFLSEARKELSEVGKLKEDDIGCCVYPDINNPGETLCGDNWSEFMCQQAGGTFYPGQTCGGDKSPAPGIVQSIPVHSCNLLSVNAVASSSFLTEATPTVDPTLSNWQKVFTLDDGRNISLRFDGRWRDKVRDWTGPYGYADELLPYLIKNRIFQIPRLSLLIGIQVYFNGPESPFMWPVQLLPSDNSRILSIGRLSDWDMGIYKITQLELYAAALERDDATRAKDENDPADSMRVVVQ